MIEDLKQDVVQEPACNVPLVRSADVIVCGGGPAGVAAAVAAARSGVDTVLIENNGCLGGIWTAGMSCCILDRKGKDGIMREIMDELTRRGGQSTHLGSTYDVEIMKLLLEDICAKAGVQVRLHTHVVAAVADNGQLKNIMTESKSGREAWAAKVFVDATGDGDVAAFCGCRFSVGRESDGATQPMSLMAMLGGVSTNVIGEFVVRTNADSEAAKRRFLEEIRRGGVEPSYAMPTLFPVHEHVIAMMANHQYGVSGLNADDLTRATVDARAEIHRIVQALRSLGGPWKELVLLATAEHIGVREGRRIDGLYRITSGDISGGARHDDAVCRATFSVDVHALDASAGKGYSDAGLKSQPYDIPLRALIAKDVEGLMLAGRCISGDFISHASYRVTGNAVPIGQAAGAAAAVAALKGLSTHQLKWEAVRSQLEIVRQNCFQP